MPKAPASIHPAAAAASKPSSITDRPIAMSLSPDAIFPANHAGPPTTNLATARALPNGSGQRRNAATHATANPAMPKAPASIHPAAAAVSTPSSIADRPIAMSLPSEVIAFPPLVRAPGRARVRPDAPLEQPYQPIVRLTRTCRTSPGTSTGASAHTARAGRPALPLRFRFADRDQLCAALDFLTDGVARILHGVSDGPG